MHTTPTYFLYDDFQSPIASPLHPETSASYGTSTSTSTSTSHTRRPIPQRRSEHHRSRRTSDGRPRDGHLHGSSLRRRRSVPPSSESKRRRSRVVAARRASESESDDDRGRIWEDRGEETGGRRDTVLSESDGLAIGAGDDCGAPGLPANYPQLDFLVLCVLLVRHIRASIGTIF